MTADVSCQNLFLAFDLEHLLEMAGRFEHVADVSNTDLAIEETIRKHQANIIHACLSKIPIIVFLDF